MTTVFKLYSSFLKYSTVRRNLGMNMKEHLVSDSVFRFVEEDLLKALLLLGIQGVASDRKMRNVIL